MLPKSALASNVRFKSSMCSINGSDEYCAAADRWHSESVAELQDYKTSVLRVAAADDEVVVRWRSEWSDEKSRWLAQLAGLLRWRIERFDLDSGRVSTFSWKAVFTLLGSAAATGTIRLPASAVEGTSRLRLESSGGEEASLVVSSHREAIDLVSTADAGQLRNRRSAQDVATFLDFHRPSDVDPDEWAAQVKARVLAGVPGAGELDIDPMEDENEGVVALSAFALVSLVASTFFFNQLGGDAISTPFTTALCDEVAGTADWGQCVSDMYGG